MVTWATKRKLQYILSFFLVIFIVSGYIYYKYEYKPPTCFDGKQNGIETGVDCGGDCKLICPRQNIEPVVKWTRIFEISSSTYSLLALVENPNVNAGASDARYTFRVKDKNDNVLKEINSSTYIPVSKIFGVFEGPIVISSGTPKTVTFNFDPNTIWNRAERNDTSIKATRIRMTQEAPTPRIDASITNSSYNDIPNIEAVAVVYDSDNNAIAASRTKLDVVNAQSSADVTFTWPKPFASRFGACEVANDIVLVIDRSGSMISDGKNPPEPLTSVKNAASTFVDALGSNSRVAVVSFASNASKPADLGLSSNIQSIRKAISSIKIAGKNDQETNFKSAFEATMNILNTSGTMEISNSGDNNSATSASSSVTNDSTTTVASNTNISGSVDLVTPRKIAILLTDGDPTEPKKKSDPLYASLQGSQAALDLKNSGVELYAIGLGANVKEDYLRNISSGTGHYYKAPTKADLKNIYGLIATSLCKKNPVIDIIPRVFPVK